MPTLQEQPSISAPTKIWVPALLFIQPWKGKGSLWLHISIYVWLLWQCCRLTYNDPLRSDAGVATQSRTTNAKACRTCDKKTLFSFQRGIYARCPSSITELSLGTKARTFCHLATLFSLRNRPILRVAKASNRKQWRVARVNVDRRSWAQLSTREERMISICRKSSLQLLSGKPGTDGFVWKFIGFLTYLEKGSCQRSLSRCKEI